MIGLVSSKTQLSQVREELLGLSVPEDLLESQVVSETLIPYPVQDRRLERWLEEVERSGTADATPTNLHLEADSP